MEYARRMLNTHKISLALAVMAFALPFISLTQEVERDVPVLSEELTGRLDGFSYQEGPESELEFRGTAIALGAEGEAEVEFQEGRARVDVSVEDLPAPSASRSVFDLRAVGRHGRWQRQQHRLDRSARMATASSRRRRRFRVRADRERGAALRGDGPEPCDRAAEPRQAGARREIQHRRTEGTHRLFLAFAAAVGPGRQGAGRT